MGDVAQAWRKPRGFVVDVLPTLLYLALLFAAGLAPLDHLPGPEFKYADKAWHLVAFGGLAGLLARSLYHFGRPIERANRQAALAAAALGGLLEILQSLTPFRAAELADLLADSLGALLAYLVLRALS